MADSLKKLNKAASDYTTMRKEYYKKASKKGDITSKEAEDVTGYEEEISSKESGNTSPYSEEYSDKMDKINTKMKSKELKKSHKKFYGE